MPSLLIDGFKKCLKEHYESQNPLMPQLTRDGQDPNYFMISCIDSRSNAGTVFQAPPGTFFSHKAMGAIVRPYKQGTALAAALQFALNYNNVKTIIILGHTGCGAVKALIEDMNDPEISSFVQVAKSGLDKAKHDHSCDKPLQRKAEEYIVRLSRENIETYPSVRKALDENRLTIKAWIFDMENGALLEESDDTKKFNVIAQRTANA